METPSQDRLGSWKAIAAYVNRDVTTVQRWERREGMPVHRHVHDKRGSVYAFRSELDAWIEDRRPASRSEEHTSELQSQSNLVCRLLLEKKKKKQKKKKT